jgi:hypothetical protein
MPHFLHQIATAMASASTGADAHASDESVACGRIERRAATQEGAVAAGRSQGTGVNRVGAVGEPTASGPARLMAILRQRSRIMVNRRSECRRATICRYSHGRCPIKNSMPFGNPL